MIRNVKIARRQSFITSTYSNDAVFDKNVFDKARTASCQHEQFDKQIAQRFSSTKNCMILLPVVPRPVRPSPILNDIETTIF